MTLCIALCDDDKIALNNELRLIKDVLNEKKIKHSIDIFSSPQKLLQSDTVYDIIFLDIEMAIDGLIIYTDTTNIKEMNKELHSIGVNINQIAKRVNETGSIYEEDIKEIQERLNKIWQLQRTILLTLP